MTHDPPPTNTVFFEPRKIRDELDDDGSRLFDHWLGLCPRPGAPPERARIDPLDFPYALPGIALVDVRGGRDDFVYRLVGTRDVEERGYDPTWKKVKDTYFAHAPDVVLDLYEDARRGVPFVAVEKFRKDNGLPVTDVALFMPLTDPAGSVITVMVYSFCRPDPMP